jgi:hypothetical protein
MQGLWVVGVLFGLGFLMVVGLHSVLRELLARGPYAPDLHPSSAAADAVGIREDSKDTIDVRDNRSIGVQVRRA